MKLTQYDSCEQRQPSGLVGLPFFAVLLVLTLAQNADWGSNRLIWWGSVGVFIATFFGAGKGILKIDVKFTIWIISFFAICAVSILWATKTSLVFTVLKSMVIHVVILLFVRSAIQDKQGVEQVLKVILVSIVINVVWLLITNRTMFETTGGSDAIIDRLGTEGTWNANDVGMMAAMAMLISLYFQKSVKNIPYRCMLFGIIALMILAVLLSGSRKALVMVLAGFCGFLFLTAKGRKRIRAVLVIALGLIALYYLTMEVPFFYSVIGWRVEGFIASLTGVGEIDSSTLKREAYAEDAIRVWKANPLLGVGLDCYRTLNNVDDNMYAHNNYIELLADLGIVGTAVYYSAHLYCLVNLLKIKQKDSLIWLLLTILLIQLVMDYGCVSYNSLTDGTLRMIIFCVISIRKVKKQEYNFVQS